MKRLALVISVCLLFIFTETASANELKATSWEEESIYFLLVDRFYNGDSSNDVHVNTQDPKANHGGDFQGVINKLDYINDMGFTSIRLGVVFDKNDYLGNEVQDFYKTDDQFGTIADFKRLVAEAHKKGIKIMIDLPLIETKESELIDIATFWIKETDVDGFVIKNMNLYSVKTWENFVDEVKAIDKEVYLISHQKEEVDNDAQNYLNIGFDSVSNHSYNKQLLDTFIQPDKSLRDLFKLYDDMESNHLHTNFIKYIDDDLQPRFTSYLIEENQFPGDRWPLLLTFMYTTPGTPMIYYGSEIALNGGRDVQDNHKLMDFRADPDLIEFIENLATVRNTYPSLTKGDLKLLYEKNGMIMYLRTYENETTLITLNNTSKNQDIEIPAEDIGENKQLVGLLEGELIKEHNGKFSIRTHQEKAEIFIIREHTGVNIMNAIIMGAVPVVFIILFFIMWKRGKRKE